MPQFIEIARKVAHDMQVMSRKFLDQILSPYLTYLDNIFAISMAKPITMSTERFEHALRVVRVSNRRRDQLIRGGKRDSLIQYVSHVRK